MSKAKIFLTLSLVSFFAACAGRFQYFPPTTNPLPHNSVTISMSKDEFWKRIIPALGKSFFVINNLDKDSGIINVSYSGDPEKYVDCGQVNSYVKNARGERVYDFPAARAHQTYEVMDMEHGGGLFFIERRMNLEGRINIIIEEISSKTCQITVNTKYVLTKSITARNVQGASSNFSDTISFVSGQQARFPGSGSFSGTLCQPNGKLEQEILAILTQQIE